MGVTITIPVEAAIELEVRLEPAAGRTVTLALRVPPGSSASPVSLYEEGGALLERARFDNDGRGTFERLAPGSYVIKFETSEGVWDVPLELVPARSSS